MIQSDVKHITFKGLEAVEISTAKLRLVVVTSMGPRIAYFGRIAGPNILIWDLDNIRRGDWVLYGGHRVWITRPLADETEEVYIPDNDPCTVSQDGDALVVTGALLPPFHTRRGFKIRILTEDSFEVTSFVANQGPLVYSAGVWGHTCIDTSGDKEYGILLGDRRPDFDVVRVLIPRAFAGHSARVNDPQITFNEDFLLARAMGIECKRLVTAPSGIIAMTWPEQSLSFIKRASYIPNGRYPMDCNLAVFIGQDNFMMEMETYGELQTVLPGTMTQLVEIWKVADEVVDWKDAAHLIDLMK